ncbi:hypothetical protein [Paraliomyxa miuraensis]|uniref:hypothetical protein n=1 Tax=Paraliomyxa miuraensis TaxID=376150 RepID=UPI0022560C63|nr:hypothetical protein [Paraliomyxa miuraensis]MCX4247795.1 hypothetical protein [Paraliomyxa miuraensis]
MRSSQATPVESTPVSELEDEDELEPSPVDDESARVVLDGASSPVEVETGPGPELEPDPIVSVPDESMTSGS